MIKFFLKLIFSLSLLAWVLHKTDLSNVAAAFQQEKLSFLLLAFSLHFVGIALTVVRWRVLLQALGHPISYLRLTKSFWIGMFFNTFSISTVGGDVSRGLDFKKELGGARSFAVVFVERFSGLVALILLAALVLPFAGNVIPKGSYLTEIIIGILAFFVLFILGVLLPQTSRLLGKESKLARFHAGLVVYSNHLKPLGLAFVLGLLLQVNVIIHYYLLGLGLGLDLSLLYFCIIVPILRVVLLLPVAINGVGLRESAFTYFFQVVGIGSASALAISWLDLGMVLVIGLIGGVIYVFRKKV